MQTILGAGGTIGKLLAKDLRQFTDEIRLVSRNPQKINEKDQLFPADLSDPAQVDKAIAGSDVVYLVVGFDYSLKVWQKNWPALMRATIDACKKHNAKLVFFDNMYLYDIDSIGHMTENSPINPPSKKGQVRREIADMLTEAWTRGEITALIARSADFYGPDNGKSFVTETVLKNLKKGKSAQWFINADAKHSFTYTPDAARATAMLGNQTDTYNQVWHLPTVKKPITGREMTALFAKEMGKENKLTVISMRFLKILGWFIPMLREMPEMMYQLERDYFFDSTKFNTRFNFQTTSYEEGVRITVRAETNAANK